MIKFLKTFKGGIHIPDYKSATCNLSIEATPLPKKVIIPIQGYGARTSELLVNVGDEVKTGQVIAKSKKFISSPIHASISGKVTKIDDFPHPELDEAKSILIESDGKDEKFYTTKKRNDKELSNEDIKQIIKDAGIVGMGGASFPTHVKFTIPEDKKVDSFIINLCECEPYLTADYRLALERPDEIFEGIEIAQKALGAEYAFIAIEDNKRKAFALLNKKAGSYPQIKVISLKTKYPQGEEKQLIGAVLNKIVPKGKSPFEVGVVVDNIQTVLAIYEAVCLNKPLYEKVITVTGEGIGKPKNLRVRVGALLKDIIEVCGGITCDEVEIIFGGPMMGVAVDNLEVPILKGTPGVLILPKERIDLQEELPCIRCGRCVDVCPVGLLPTELNKLVENKQWDALDELYISECMECGSCAYVCPSKIPLVQRIKKGKEILAKKQRENK